MHATSATVLSSVLPSPSPSLSPSLAAEVAVICGTQGEAALWQNTGARVACSAADFTRALALARELVATSTGALLSFGTAGGLDPALPSGTLLIGSHVHDSDNGSTFVCDAALVAKMTSALPDARLARFYGARALLADVKAKQRAFMATACAAVDMESAALAIAAAELGRPFGVLRVIIDHAEYNMPHFARLPLDDAGNPRIGAIMASLLRQPSQVRDCLHLARLWGKAKRVLHKSVVVYSQSICKT